MVFKDLKFKVTRGGASPIQAITFFENGYGASVILEKDFFRLNTSEPRYELAVLSKIPLDYPFGEEFTEKEGDKSFVLCYSTPITDDVIRNLSEDGVSDLLQKIEQLPDTPYPVHQ